MRKVVVKLALVAFVAGLVLSSCGSSHTCPAYGKAETQNIEKNA